MRMFATTLSASLTYWAPQTAVAARLRCLSPAACVSCRATPAVMLVLAGERQVDLVTLGQEKVCGIDRSVVIAIAKGLTTS